MLQVSIGLQCYIGGPSVSAQVVMFPVGLSVLIIGA